MTNFASTLRRFAVAFTLAVFALGLSPAQAQSDDFTSRVSSQITTLLESDDPAMQKKGVSLVTQLAEKDDPVVNPKSFQSTVTAIYRDTDRAEGLRIAAVDALVAMGEAEVVAPILVASFKTETSPRVRDHTLALLTRINEG